ncbi:MAG: lysylphosphatidylglycerol synthase transmembrane domain-containing protein [Candidatus Omnitrophica bacterium]|nr:lysylphosphatidylglycerol synthase transmembrane domain-containing protein [Candidatus Omnitrophota bacterium]
MKIIKKMLSMLLRVGISILILYYLFRQVDKNMLIDVLHHSDKVLLFAAFVIFQLGNLFCALRWHMLLRAAKIHLALRRVLISFCGGLFFNLFLPSSIGGDLMRAIDLSRHTNRSREVVATVLLDRISGYVGLVLITLFAVIIGGKLIENTSVIVCVIIITVVLILGLLVLFNMKIYSKISAFLGSGKTGKIKEYIKDIHHEMHIFKQHKAVIVNNVIFSLLVQITGPLMFYLIAVSMGLKLKLIYFFVYIPIIGAVSMLPISIGGLGLRDAATIYFFGKAGVAKNLAFAMSLVNFSFILITGIIGGLIYYVFAVRNRRIQSHPQR